MALGQSVAKRSRVPHFRARGHGRSFFYGDAVLTPAISVLSAVEGLKLVAPAIDPFVVPVTIIILVGLFAVQSRGTGRVATFLGPIMLVWFGVLALGGLIHIVDDPRVFLAFNPYFGAKFLATHGLIGLTILGLVFLAVTGAEALYADLGHFGRKPIQMAWSSVVLPALIAQLSRPRRAGAGQSGRRSRIPFYKLYPSWALIPMVCMATVATVIASQAVITGAFSITRQAMQLGLLPRFSIQHTSESVEGQIYLPRVNQLLLVGVLLTVLSVPQLERSCGRLRRRGDGHHGHRFGDGILRHLAVLALAAVEGARADRAADRDRAGVLRGQHAQGARGRMVPAGHRQRWRAW